MMTIKENELARIRQFVVYLIGDKGGYPEGGAKNKDGTYTLYRHTYERLLDIAQAKSYEELNKENKYTIDKQIEMYDG